MFRDFDAMRLDEREQARNPETPRYRSLPKGELRRRAERLAELMSSCTICPRNCRVDRLNGEIGACGIGSDAVVSSYGAHFGEESVLVGRFGSGTIFMTGCNLACVFCQNHDISQLRRGHAVPMERLAEVIGLQGAATGEVSWNPLPGRTRDAKVEVHGEGVLP